MALRFLSNPPAAGCDDWGGHGSERKPANTIATDYYFATTRIEILVDLSNDFS